MANEPRQIPPLFTQYDVSSNTSSDRATESKAPYTEMIALLQDILAALRRPGRDPRSDLPPPTDGS